MESKVQRVLKMYLKIYSCLLFLVFACYKLSAQEPWSSIKGVVRESTDSSEIVGAKIEVFDEDSVLVYGTYTDFEGWFKLSPLPIGRYNLKVSSPTFTTIYLKGVLLKASYPCVQHFYLQRQEGKVKVRVERYQEPQIASPGIRLVTAEEVAKMAVRELDSISEGGKDSLEHGSEQCNCLIRCVLSYPPDNSNYGISQEFMRGSASRTIFTFH